MRTRRVALLALITVLIAVGVTTVAGRVISLVIPPSPTSIASARAVSDTELTGFASVAAVDYLSWDTGDKQTRQTALGRYAAADTVIDGWDGTGRMVADFAQPTALARGGGDRAVITVRVRVTPFSGAPGQPAAGTSDAGGNIASQPVPSAPGWTALPARWVSLAVPVGVVGGRLAVTAAPALVGSATSTVAGAAVPDTTSGGDEATATATKDTIKTLLGAYGTSQLDYARATGSTFTGLGSAATLESVQAWRVRALESGTVAAKRIGDATVTWTLSGGAGRLTCSYLVTLQQQDQRWYLAAISAESEGVKR